MTHVKVTMGMKTNANTHSGHHGQSVIAKRKPSYDPKIKPFQCLAMSHKLCGITYES